MQLHAHPFSSYCQKALVALYENDTPFEWRVLDSAQAWAELESLWPIKRMPVLVDEGRVVVEASLIVEYLDNRYPGSARLVPADFDAALAVRMLDRFFDNYVHAPMQRIVADFMRDPGRRDAHGVAQAHALLETSYHWLDDAMAQREWAAGSAFSLADCAAAPALFYADWVHPIPEALTHVRAYRKRLLARPSFARAVEEARPLRHLFPPGAPDRD